MQEIINQIATKAGITPEQASSALVTVMDFVKSKVPGTVATQIDGLLAGKDFDLTAILKGEASIKINDFKETATEKLGDLKEEATEKFNDLKDGAKSFIDKIL